MNYFAHAHRFLLPGVANPYFLAGTAVPDWLNVVARHTKCRRQHVQPFLDDSTPYVAELARGIAQHHDDDRWFHATRSFVELSLRFAKTIRASLADESDLRAGFLGHIVVELLLDAELIADQPSLLDDYYLRIDSIDEKLVAEIVGSMCGRPVGDLAEFITRFVDLRFLADYEDDLRLCYRLNQVLGRVALPPLPLQFTELLPTFRKSVSEHRSLLLTADSNS